MGILIDYLSTNNHKKIAKITFDNPKSLNAQTLEMTQMLNQCLTDWQDDEDIAVVVLCGAADKAFCAGGDIRGLYYACVGGDVNDNNAKQSASATVRDFFGSEYEAIARLRHYPKPVLAWGSGIVMGGGFGLLAAASHKVVTDSTLMAMPEVSIGLFPDAGASYFLRQISGKIGLFLGLTGARITATDALFLGLADFKMADDLDTLLECLSVAVWGDDKYNHSLLNRILSSLAQHENWSNSGILANFNEINRLMNAGDLLNVDQALRQYQGDSQLIQNAIDSYTAGSDLTKAIAWQIYHKKILDYQQIVDLELATAINCCIDGDFVEGVRALLIDKDKNPRWGYQLDDNYAKVAEGFFWSLIKETL